jgi:hypothetical protein
MSAFGPSQGANCAPASGGSAAVELANELANEAASVGGVPCAAGPKRECALASGSSVAAEFVNEAPSVEVLT